MLDGGAAGPSPRARGRQGNQCQHERSWARHQTITDPGHAAAAAGHTTAAVKHAPTDLTEVKVRSLDSYDRIFGVTDGGLTTR